MRSALLLLAAAAASALVACTGGTAADDDDQGSKTAAQNGEAANDADSCKKGESRSCTISGNAGTETCEATETGATEWGTCQPQATGSSTPLVLVFEPNARVAYHTRAAAFDLAGNGTSQATDWPTAKTPWLALDRNGNGRIDDGAELFGSMTRLASGTRASNGFEALAELDSNHDGVVSADDADFAKLVVWSDDGDRVSSLSELRPAADSIVRIELAYRNESRCTQTGNCEVERARFVYRDAAGSERDGEVVDVHLRHR